MQRKKKKEKATEYKTAKIMQINNHNQISNYARNTCSIKQAL